MYIGLAESFLNQRTRRTWSPGLGEVRLQGNSTELRATQDTVTVFSGNIESVVVAGMVGILGTGDWEVMEPK